MGVGTPEDLIEGIASGSTCSIVFAHQKWQKRAGLHVDRQAEHQECALDRDLRPLDESCRFAPCVCGTRAPICGTFI